MDTPSYLAFAKVIVSNFSSDPATVRCALKQSIFVDGGVTEREMDVASVTLFGVILEPPSISQDVLWLHFGAAAAPGESHAVSLHCEVESGFKEGAVSSADAKLTVMEMALVA